MLQHIGVGNHERAAEEMRGLIRWLRPDFQAPGAATAQQSEIGLSDDDATQEPPPPSSSIEFMSVQSIASTLPGV